MFSFAVVRLPVPVQVRLSVLFQKSERECCTHLDGNAVQPHPQHVVHKRLVCPAVLNHRHKVDIPVQNHQHCQITTISEGFCALQE